MKKRIIAWAVLLSVCAAALGLWCSAAADNAASLRLFEKAGYDRCGYRRDWLLTADGPIDEVLMQKILGL